jgi:hypothetical protein
MPKHIWSLVIGFVLGAFLGRMVFSKIGVGQAA